MKKILLIVSVALLICAMLVVSVSAAEWKANSSSILVSVYGDTVSIYDEPLEYKFYLPSDTSFSGIDYVASYVRFYFDGSDYVWNLYGSENGTEFVIIQPSEWTIGEGEVTIVSDAEGANLDDAINLFNTYVASVLSPIESEPPSLIGSLTAIFSGVSTWLISGVVLLIGIFWTGSALTPLGYLAVAGLAISVILLIFYLISRFLKFRG